MGNVSWPDNLPSTRKSEREPYSEGPGFQVTEERAHRKIKSQLDKLGASNVQIFDDGQVVVVEYTLDGDEHVVGSDKWDNIRDNKQAIVKYFSSKRAIERYCVKTPKDEWENTKLPDVRRDTEEVSLFNSVVGVAEKIFGNDVTEDVTEDVPYEMSEVQARMILGVDNDVSENEIKNEIRNSVKDLHPDQGGDEERFKALMQAKEVLVD